MSTRRTTKSDNCTLAQNAVASSPPFFPPEESPRCPLFTQGGAVREKKKKKNAARIYKAANSDRHIKVAQRDTRGQTK